MRGWITLLVVVFATSASAHPCPDAKPAKPPAKKASPSTRVPRSNDVVQLYTRTGHALARVRQNSAAEPLMMRYRLINIADVLANPSKRADAVAALDKINADLKKLVP